MADQQQQQLGKVSENFLDAKQPFASCDFGLDRRLTKAVAKMQFVYATLVQVHCIPLAMQGKDLLVRARTGSGKTAAFGLPLLHKILQQKQDQSSAGALQPSVKALVLVPTKELVEQTKRHMSELMYYCNDVVSLLALGGQSMNAQQALLRDVPDIIIATPGRLVAHLEAGNLKLKDSVQTLVIDEADLVLSFGYGEDIRTIFNHLPKACQNFCMSATLSPELEKLKKSVLHNPAVVKLEEGETDGKLQQYYLPVSQADKELLLYALIKLGVIHGKVIFFVNTTEAAYRLKLFFEQFIIKSAVLNAELPHNSRQHIIEEYNRGLFDYLIATDDSVDRDVGEGSDDEEEEEDGEDDDDDDDDDDDEKPEDDDDAEVEADSEAEDNEDEDDDDNMDEDDEDAAEDDDDEDNESDKPAAKKAANGSNKRKRDESYGVSRGVDFRGVNFVINVDFPKSVRAYTHRIGRTARGGANGTALSLVALADAKQKRYLDRVQASQKPVLTPSKDLLKQPAELSFDLKEIDCFRYRVEDVRRAVTSVAVREAQLADVKKEILNSEKLVSHFEANPRDLNILEHDKAIGTARVQPHLATIPDYLVPIALQAAAPQKKHAKKNKRMRMNKDGKRRTDNDPLHTFTHGDEGEHDEVVRNAGEDGDKKSAPKVEEDRITFGNSGVGKSTAGRQKWKQNHRKGRFNPKTIAKKKYKAKFGFSH
uniref:RNA helicase n=1 Tax=Globisporangium ultimum (strain ATCC 200006 / CBS 805.95 / DAOM BR144) TaxID=431595 RepID=K3WG30_GLOUD